MSKSTRHPCPQRTEGGNALIAQIDFGRTSERQKKSIETSKAGLTFSRHCFWLRSEEGPVQTRGKEYERWSRGVFEFITGKGALKREKLLFDNAGRSGRGDPV